MLKRRYVTVLEAEVVCVLKLPSNTHAVPSHHLPVPPVSAKPAPTLTSLAALNPTPESPPHFPWNSGVPEKAHSPLCKVHLAVMNHASILGAQIHVSSCQAAITKTLLYAPPLLLWSLITGPRFPNPHPAHPGLQPAHSKPGPQCCVSLFPL